MSEKFGDYLLGHKCVVFTDNNPLSHLHLAKLGATEQRWASQLAIFDKQLVPGIAVPKVLQEASVSALSGHSTVNIGSLQEADPLLKEVRSFWKRQIQPSAAERRHGRVTPVGPSG